MGDLADDGQMFRFFFEDRIDLVSPKMGEDDEEIVHGKVVRHHQETLVFGQFLFSRDVGLDPKEPKEPMDDLADAPIRGSPWLLRLFGQGEGHAIKEETADEQGERGQIIAKPSGEEQEQIRPRLRGPRGEEISKKGGSKAKEYADESDNHGGFL